MRKTWPSDAPELIELLLFSESEEPEELDDFFFLRSSGREKRFRGEQGKRRRTKRRGERPTKDHHKQRPGDAGRKTPRPKTHQDRNTRCPKTKGDRNKALRRAAKAPQRVVSPARCVHLRTHRLRDLSRKSQQEHPKKNATPHQPRSTDQKRKKGGTQKEKYSPILFVLLGPFSPFGLFSFVLFLVSAFTLLKGKAFGKKILSGTQTPQREINTTRKKARKR